MSIANNAFATRINYVRGVKILILHYEKLPEECTVHEIKSFLVFLKETMNYSSSTLNLRICSLKYYFREVVNRLDLVTKIPNHRFQKYDTEIMTSDELNRIFNSGRDMRQKLVVTMLYDTGIRISELIRVKLSDFDKQNSSIIIRNSKGKKTRVVYYGRKLREVIKQYCQTMGRLPKDTLIENYNNIEQPLSLRGGQHIVREVVKRSGIRKKISPHSFRHTFAVHYLNYGGSIFRLQKLLGHTHISTTLNYLKYAFIPDSSDLSPFDNLPQ